MGNPQETHGVTVSRLLDEDLCSAATDRAARASFQHGAVVFGAASLSRLMIEAVGLSS